MAINNNYEFEKIIKELTVNVAEKKRHASIYGTIICGDIMVGGIIGLVTSIVFPGLLPLAIPAVAVIVSTAIGLNILVKAERENQKKAMDVQRNIVESVENPEEAKEMQDTSKKKMDKNSEKLSIDCVGTVFSCGLCAVNPIIGEFIVQNIQKGFDHSIVALGLSALTTIIGTISVSEAVNASEHQKVLKIKSNPARYRNVKD